MVASGYLVLKLTDSTFQTQLVGVAFFSSMLLGGILSGVVADAFDRKRVLIVAHLIDLAVLGITVFLVFTGLAEGWHIVMLSAVYGVPHTLDMAARRTFALDIVGRRGISYANALEGMSMMAAGMLGPFLAGVLIDLVPLGKSAEATTPYLFIMAIYTTALLALLRVRSPKPQNKIPIRLTDVFTPIGEGARAIASNRAVIGTLGVIVIMNLLYFSYIPLVPVFADKVLGVGPILLGDAGVVAGLRSIPHRHFHNHKAKHKSQLHVLCSRHSCGVQRASGVFTVQLLSAVRGRPDTGGSRHVRLCQHGVHTGAAVRGRGDAGQGNGIRQYGDRDIAAVHAGLGLACRSHRPWTGGVTQRLGGAAAERTVVVPLQGDAATLVTMQTSQCPVGASV